MTDKNTCKCSMRTSALGDGCMVCNPEYHLSILTDQLNELKNTKVEDDSEFLLNLADLMGDIITTQDAVIECQARIISKIGEY